MGLTGALGSVERGEVGGAGVVGYGEVGEEGGIVGGGGGGREGGWSRLGGEMSGRVVGI